MDCISNIQCNNSSWVAFITKNTIIDIRVSKDNNSITVMFGKKGKLLIKLNIIISIIEKTKGKYNL
jgi:hypothetical protein